MLVTDFFSKPKNYPPKWDVFDAHARHADPQWFGLFSSTGDVNRFAARYRLAKSFKGIKLDGYSAGTEQGYAVLLKVCLTYSAFELFLPAIGTNQAALGALLAKYDSGAWIATIRAADIDDRFYRFIYERVNARHQQELDNYFHNDPCNVTYLASAIRHIFLHGHLTPNANQASQEAVVGVSKTLYEGLMKIMDTEFEQRMAEFEDMIS